MSCLFVYYKLAPAQLAATVASVRAMQSTLQQAHAGLCAGLLRRPALDEGRVTLMETYTGALPPDMAATLAKAAQQGAWPQPRHAEWFDALD